MNPKQSIFETCNSNQTAIELNTNKFEPCDNNQTKTGRGGYRKNSGAKSSGIKTITVRIDERFLNTVTRTKAEFKDGNLILHDLFAKPEPQNNDAKLLKKIAKLEREKNDIHAEVMALLESERTEYEQKIKTLQNENHELFINMVDKVLTLKEEIERLKSVNISSHNGIDKKLVKRLIQFCHPDPIQDLRKKAIAEELTKELNGLAK